MTIHPFFLFTILVLIYGAVAAGSRLRNHEACRPEATPDSEADSRKQTAESSQSPALICARCGVTIRRGSHPASHGLCPTCYLRESRALANVAGGHRPATPASIPTSNP